MKAFNVSTMLVRHQVEHLACKNRLMRCWCLEREYVVSYGPSDATAIVKPHHLLPHLNPDWLYLSGTYRLTHVVLEKRLLNECSSSTSWEMHVGATWRMRWIDLCGIGDATCHFRYCSNLLRWLITGGYEWCTPVCCDWRLSALPECKTTCLPSVSK